MSRRVPNAAIVATPFKPMPSFRGLSRNTRRTLVCIFYTAAQHMHADGFGRHIPLWRLAATHYRLARHGYLRLVDAPGGVRIEIPHDMQLVRMQ